MGIQQILLIVLSIIIVGVAITVGISMYNNQNLSTETYELIALSNNSEISGKFFILSGTLGTENIYKCMIKYNGGYKMVTLNPDYATIYEINDGSVPRIEGRYSEYDKQFSIIKEIKVYIPTNSILNKFEIDVSK